MLIFAKDNKIIQDLYQEFISTSNLEVTNLGELKDFLRIEVIKDLKDNKIYLSQASYIKRILKKFKKEEIKTRKVPLPSIKLEKNSTQALDKDITRF